MTESSQPTRGVPLAAVSPGCEEPEGNIEHRPGIRLAQELLRQRRRVRLSQRGLGRVSGVSWTLVQTLERGHRHGKPVRPLPNTLRRLARGLATDPLDESVADERQVDDNYRRLMVAAGYVESTFLSSARLTKLAVTGMADFNTLVDDHHRPAIRELATKLSPLTAESAGDVLAICRTAADLATNGPSTVLARAQALLNSQVAIYMGTITTHGARGSQEAIKQLRLAAHQDGLQVIREYVEEQVNEHSSFSERPAARQLLNDAAAGLFTKVLTPSPHVFGCSERRALDTVIELAHHGVTVAVINMDGGAW